MFNDFKEALSLFLSKNALWIAVAICGVIILTALLFALLNFKKK